MKGDAKHPSGSEDWRTLCGGKWVSLKKYSQYLALWVPTKKPESQQTPHGDACLPVTHVSKVLKIRFYCLFLDICFYWLLYLLPIGCVSLAFSVSHFSLNASVCRRPMETWKFHLNIHILKKFLFCITNEVKSNLGMPHLTVVSKIFWKF